MKALVFYIETGAGFKSPAVAIARELEAAGHEAKAVDLFKAIGANVFDALLVRGWRFFLKAEFLFRLLFAFADSFLYDLLTLPLAPLYRKRILAYAAAEGADFIVSTHFVGTAILQRVGSRRRPLPLPVFGYNSDVILSHKAYTNTLVDAYFVSTGVGREAMIEKGMPAQKVVLTGFPIDPKYRQAFGPVAEERRRLGLEDRFTLLLAFGGEGVGDWSLVRRLEAEGLPVQVVAICGKNEALKAEIEAWAARHPAFALQVRGFTTNMQDYLHCCDIAAGKSGLNSVFEAIYMKRPFLVLKAMANEAQCADWLRREGYGWWPRNLEESVGIVRAALGERAGGRGPEPSLAAIAKTLEAPPCGFGIQEMVDTMIENTNDSARERLRSAKAICFDLAGTLCDIPIGESWEAVNVAGIRQVFEYLGLAGEFAPEEIEGFVAKFIDEKKRLRKEAKVSLREYEIRGQVRDFLAELGAGNPRFAALAAKRALTESDWDRIEYLYIEPELDITVKFEEAPALLAALKGRYPLYLLSNNVSRVLVEKIVERTGLSGYFERIFVSSEVGYRKPHEAFMKAVVEGIGLDPGDCVMVGDRLTQDIEMANRFGMMSIHMAMVDHEDNQGAGHIRASVRVGSLGEIAKLLG